MARRKTGGAPTKERRLTKKKTSILTSESIEWVDYKDVNLLRRFMSERAKIRARRVTGNDQQQQVAVARGDQGRPRDGAPSVQRAAGHSADEGPARPRPRSRTVTTVTIGRWRRWPTPKSR